MTAAETRTTARWRLLAHASVVASLALVILLGLWGAYRDVAHSRYTIVASAAARLRSQAARRAAHIESVMGRSGGGASLKEFAGSEWLRRYWEGADEMQPGQLYAALVAPDGEILLHSNPAYVGRSVGDRWYHREAEEMGPNLYEIDARVLDDSEATLDVATPIEIDGSEVGVYHEGLSRAWIDARVASARRRVVARWSVVVGSIALVVLLGMASIFYISRHSVALRRALEVADVRRVAEIGRLAGGLAHEVRNPLHAVRINLHTLRSAFTGPHALTREELVRITEESEREIERVDQLLRELLGYAQPEESRAAAIDVTQEVEGTLSFLREDLRQANVDLRFRRPDSPTRALVDPNRLRQVLVNLLLNARDALPHGGVVSVSVAAAREWVVIEVSDDGSGVPPDELDRIFEPFVTSKPGGTGFGLAMAKRYVEEAGGTIECKRNAPRGATFVVRLPPAPRNRQAAE